MMLNTTIEVADYLGIEYDKNNPPDPIEGWVKRDCVPVNQVWANVTSTVAIFKMKRSDQMGDVVNNVSIPCALWDIDAKLSLLKNPITLD